MALIGPRPLPVEKRKIKAVDEKAGKILPGIISPWVLTDITQNHLTNG